MENRQGQIDKIRFPEPWTEKRANVSEPQPAYLQNLEVRKSSGAPPGEYLLAGMMGGDNDYMHELYTDLPPPHYTVDSYAVNFAENFRVRSIAEDEWRQAERISTHPRWLFIEQKGEAERQDFVYRGFRYVKSGEHLPGPAWLSPGGKWLAVFSYSGRKTKPDLLFGGGEPRTGDVFWDIYDTATGEKVSAWWARQVSDPASFNKATAWIGERYFLAPAEQWAQTYLLFTLPAFVPPPNPGTLRFPAWLDANGKPMQLPSAQDKDVEWSGREYEIRRLASASTPGPGEFLFRLKDRRIVLLPPSRGPDGGGLRGRQARTVYSANVYAVALDNSYRMREAAPGEWEQAKPVEATQNQRTLDETYSSFGGERRTYRHFKKSGADWGVPKALGSAGWLAVFSYTASRVAPASPDRAATQTSARVSGTMFVEVYDARPGTRMLTARTPYDGSATALFGGARWHDQNYLVVPLESSYRSCLLGMLPEVGRLY